MTESSDPNDQGAEPETDQERALLAAYRAADEAGRVIVWAALLAELGRRSPPPEDAEEEALPGPSGGHALSGLCGASGGHRGHARCLFAACGRRGMLNNVDSS